MDILTGGGQKQSRLSDLVERFERGETGENISNEDAMNHYSTVAQNLSPTDYRSAAEEAISKLNPEQRQELVQRLQSEARQSDVNFPGLHGDDQLHRPERLANVLTDMHQQQPGLLQQLIGGSGGGQSNLLSNPIVKMALVGIAAAGARNLIHRG